MTEESLLAMRGTEQPLNIVFSPNGKPVLTITHDGRFLLGEGATIDDAARAICEVAERFLGTSKRGGVDP